VESHDGAFPINFLGRPLTNAYLNITNINLLVSPKDPAAAARPAVMIVAHHDAPVSSPGAGRGWEQDGGLLAPAVHVAAWVLGTSVVSAASAGGVYGGVVHDQSGVLESGLRPPTRSARLARPALVSWSCRPSATPRGQGLPAFSNRPRNAGNDSAPARRRRRRCGERWGDDGAGLESCGSRWDAAHPGTVPFQRRRGGAVPGGRASATTPLAPWAHKGGLPAPGSCGFWEDGQGWLRWGC
jgi:hypothetical protein